LRVNSALVVSNTNGARATLPIRAILVGKTFSTPGSIVAPVSSSEQISNVAGGVIRWVALARHGVRPSPATGGKDEEEVGASSLARSSSEPAAVSV